MPCSAPGNPLVGTTYHMGYDMRIGKISIGPAGGFALAGAAAFALWAPGRALALDVAPKDIVSFKSACQAMNFQPSPREVEGNLVFNGLSGGAQLDPQVAVGGDAVLNVSNAGILLLSKRGELIGRGSPGCLNLDFDPKIYFEPIGKRLVAASISWAGSARISIAKTTDPRGGWWAYTIPVPGWVDGGAVGGNRKWITYSYPAQGGQKVFLIDREKAESGGTVTVVELGPMTDPGQPVFSFDADQDNLYYVKLSGGSIKVNYVNLAGEMKTQPAVNHGFGLSYPAPFPQKGAGGTSAGDINAKMSVLRNGSIWTCDAATTNAGGVGRTTVRYYQVDLTGKVIQSGAIDDPTGAVYSGQATLAVNKRNDLLLVFQQGGRDMFVSSRMSYRLADDPPGALRPVIKHAEGQGANRGGAWGDYSGASVDGDNDIDMWGVNSVAGPSGGGNSVIFRLGLTGAVPVSPLSSSPPELSMRQSGGLLFLSGPGLDDGSRVDLFGLNGMRLLSRNFSPEKNGFGTLSLPVSRIPPGPVFLRLSKEGGRSAGPGGGQWISIRP